MLGLQALKIRKFDIFSSVKNIYDVYVGLCSGNLYNNSNCSTITSFFLLCNHFNLTI